MTNQLKQAIEQLYENESLTSALTDESAKLLLSWGEQQLQTYKGNRPQEFAEQLPQLLRGVNRLVEQHADMAEADLIKNLLNLAEQAIQLGQQNSTVEQTSNKQDARPMKKGAKNA